MMASAPVLYRIRSPHVWTRGMLLLLVLASTTFAWCESSNSLYKRGQAAEARSDYIAAFNDYKAAHELKPAEMKYQVSYERIRVLAAVEYMKEGEEYAKAGSLPAALAAYLRALDADPGNERAEQGTRKLQASLEHKDHAANTAMEPLPAGPAAEPPPQLNLKSAEPITLHMVQDSRIAYQALGKAIGVNVLFDPEYAAKTISVDLKEVTPYEALRIVAQVSGTFWKPVTHDTIFVALDSPSKRRAFNEEAVQIFYLKNIAQPSDFNDIQTALRNVFQTSGAKVNGLVGQNAIMIRGTPDELQLAQMLIASLDQPRPEVMVDITVMEVSRDKLREIGISPPTSLTVNSGSSQTLNQIGHSSAYSISVGQAAVDFLLSDSSTKVLQNPRLRAVDGQKANLKLGEKIPIATGSYTLATGTASAEAETQFQYQDVGVIVEMTPAIHADRDVTLKLSVEVSSELTTEDIDNVEEPVISEQKAEQVIRLKDGEPSILAGLVTSQVSKTVSGWPGFGELPLLKYFFTTQSNEVKTDELVFLITPHVVRAPENDFDHTHAIDTGTEQAIQLREVQPANQTAPANPQD